MDAVLSKIKNKVSSALPGNPLTREYEIDKQIGQAGPNMMWKLYSAKKRSTQQEATIWVMEKKILDQYPKSQKETMIELLKHGVSALTRIKHPKIISVLQPLEESRESLAFSTEPIFTSLGTALSGGITKDVYLDALKDFSLTDTEIKYGLMQISEALNFLHADCHRIHLNLVPESILINKMGLWKLGGFEFSQSLGSGDKDSVSVPIWQTSMMPATQPPLCASAPESILQSEASPASDMFSLGLLIGTLFNKGRPILDIGNDYSGYKQSVKNLSSIINSKLTNIPENLHEYVKMMLSVKPAIRPNALQFSSTPYFQDAAMSVLRSVDNIYQLDNLARSQFYKSLPAAICSLPKRLCLHRVFTQVTEDFSNPHMVPFILPAVLQIMDMVTREEFMQFMLPRLIPAFMLKEPIQIILIFLQNLKILTAKLPTAEFRTYVLPMLQSALDTDNKATQDLCLKALPNIGQAMDLNLLKNSILPRLQRLCLNAELLSTRVASLVCIGKLMDHLDKWIVMDDVLPFLVQIKSREPTVLIAILGIYRLAFSHEKLGISREKLASKVLPHLIPLSIEGNLNLKQYSAYAALIQDMCAQLEREQRAKLEQLGGMTEDNSFIQNNVLEEKLRNSANSCSELMDLLMRAYTDTAESLAAAQIAPASNGHPPDSVSSSVGDSKTSGNRSSSTNLTLEQKRQLAAQLNQMERLHGQADLTAKPADQPAQTRPKPVDLTSTLIASNVNALNRTNPGNTNRTGTGIPLALLTPPSGINPANALNFTPAPVLNKPGFNYTSASFNGLPIASVPTPNNSGYGLNAPYNNSQTSPPALPPANQPMFGGSQISQANSAIKPLSKNDIDDLLS